MHGESLYRKIVAGETGVWASPVRGLLWSAAVVYGRVIALRNGWYDRKGTTTRLPVPVISVGNLTVGGTGKTPFVIDLVRRLDALGFSPAVIARGYGATPGEPNDEQKLIQKNCPSAAYVSDPDRRRAGEVACERFGADIIVLDDGFQHRRLARDLDIVLVDATCPFGFGHVLPRGLLREPVIGLRRAHVVVLTRCNQVSRTESARIEARLRELAPDAAHLKCNHRVTTVEQLNGIEVGGGLDRKRVALFAGIAHPQSFVTTVSSLGADVVAARWFPDHHRYTRRNLQSLLQADRFPQHDFLVTTEKDAVKLAELRSLEAATIVVVRVAIDFLDDGGTMLQEILRCRCPLSPEHSRVPRLSASRDDPRNRP
jgi:tetraacyldisaccharide 4'-kinase